MIIARPNQQAIVGGQRGVGSSIYGASGPVDPLAAFDWSARLQTHNGNGVPRGLYQDTVCTIPATEDFDPVAGRRDFAGNIFATQSNEAKQPYYLEVDGVPTVQYDEVDDCFDFSAIVMATGTVFFLVNFGTSENQYLLGRNASDPTTIFGFDDNLMGFRLFADGGGYFGGLKREDVAGDFHVFTLTITANSGTVRIDGSLQPGGPIAVSSAFTPNLIGAFHGGRFFGGGEVAILFSPDAFNDTDAAIVETYLADLQP